MITKASLLILALLAFSACSNSSPQRGIKTPSALAEEIGIPLPSAPFVGFDYYHEKMSALHRELLFNSTLIAEQGNRSVASSLKTAHP